MACRALLMTLVMLFGGGFLLYLGAVFLVKGASGIAKCFGVSPLMIGLTVVAFGTSAPEMAVSVKAALEGWGSVSIGNVVGSNIFNVAVILGVSALFRPLKVNVQVLKIDTPLMVIFSVLFAVFLLDGSLLKWEAAVLLTLMFVYLGLNVFIGKKSIENSPLKKNSVKAGFSSRSLWSYLIIVLIGLIALMAGSRFFVQAAITLAQLLEISQTVVALTIVAMGTSLPELATSVVAAINNQEDIAIGNIVGSNIFNLLAISGLSGLLVPLRPDGIQAVDLLVMIGLSLLLLPLMRSGFKINRIEGLLLLLIYCAYLVYLWP